MKVNTLAINNFSKLTPLGQCDTCKYIDPKYKFIMSQMTDEAI